MPQALLVKQMRKNLKKRLRGWIPNNTVLVDKELSIFDRLMTRRDFLKTSSFAAMVAVLNQGCGDDKHNSAPSQWDESEDVVSITDMESVQTAAKIIVDSDVLSSSSTYNPLGAFNSTDSTHVKLEAVMESFNPHVMTANSTEDFEKNGIKQPNRIYGIPEHVHLVQEDDVTDYHLAVYEKANVGHHGLEKNTIPLKETAGEQYNAIVASNGSFHNRVKDSICYSQKLVLLADIDTLNAKPHLYYQTNSSELLQPGVKPSKNSAWYYIDLINEFTSLETHAFSSHTVAAIDRYHDGHNNAFIYGTICFDTYYNYGFTVSFNAITDTKPTVTFFAPEFLSYKSTTIQKLVDNYNDIEDMTTDEDELSSFSIFNNQRFRPLAMMLDSQGELQSKILFSFYNIEIVEGDATIDGGAEFDLDEIKTTMESSQKRHLLVVDTTSDAVSYMLEGYTPDASLQVEDDELSFIFDTRDIPTLDVWEDIYNKDNKQLNNAFMRSMQQDENGALEILVATLYFNQDTHTQEVGLGVTNKIVTLTHNETTAKLTNLSVQTSNTLFDEGRYTEKDYKALWFNTIHAEHSSHDSLFACAQEEYTLEFHCSHNHQGVLRNYFIVRFSTNDKGNNGYLIGFNEKGHMDTDKYPSHNHQSIKNQILNKSADDYHPPMPIAIDPHKLHKWHGLAGDGEVLYTKRRAHILDEESKTLITNDASKGKDLFSYAHASCDFENYSWSESEQQKKLTASELDDVKRYSVSQDLHQMHLHVSNIYNLEAQLDEATYVEVRFSKRLTVKDHTITEDKTGAITYHVNPFTSLFLKHDTSGKILLEIDAGSKEAHYNGATMQYRLVHKDSLSTASLENPLATLSSTDGSTTEFMECNISYKMYKRFSSENIDVARIGAPDGKTKTKDALIGHMKDEYKEQIGDIASVFTTLHSKTAPKDIPFSAISRSYTVKKMGNGLEVVVPKRLHMMQRSFWHHIPAFHPIHWIRHAARSIVHAVVDEAELIAKGIKKSVESLAKTVAMILTDIATSYVNAAQDIAAAVEDTWDAVTSFAQMLWDFLKALFDMDAALKIGQEFKQIRIDQFKKPGSTHSQNSSYNINSHIKSMSDNLTQEFTTMSTSIEDNIDDSIDKIFDTFGNDDTDTQGSMNSSNTKQKEQKQNSTSIEHLMHQISRILQTFNIEKLMDELVGGDKSAITNTFSDMVGASPITLDDITPTAYSIPPTFAEGSLPDLLLKPINEVEDDIVKLTHGDISAIGTNVKDALKQTNALIAKQTTGSFEKLISLPTKILDDDPIFSYIKHPSTVVSSVLDLFSYMFFFKSGQFKDIEELSLFMFGYQVNIVETIFGPAINDLSEKKFSSYIKDGDYRVGINTIIASLNPDASAASKLGRSSIVEDLFNIVIYYNKFNALLLTISTSVMIPGVNLLIKDPIFSYIKAVLSAINGYIDFLNMHLYLIESIPIAVVYEDDAIALAAAELSIYHSFLSSSISMFSHVLDSLQALAEGPPGEESTYDPTGVVALLDATIYFLEIVQFLLDSAFYAPSLAFDTAEAIKGDISTGVVLNTFATKTIQQLIDFQLVGWDIYLPVADYVSNITLDPTTLAATKTLKVSAHISTKSYKVLKIAVIAEILLVEFLYKGK